MPESQASLPHWMVYFAFWASIALALVQIVEWIFRASLRPTLDIHLTEEVFFRLIDLGEGLFCNPVLLASNGPVLVRDVKAVLNRTNEPTKSFPMKVVAFGEKVRGQGNLADNYFHSRSPIAYIAESIPQRAVYFCIQDKYQTQTQQVFSEFHKNIWDCRANLLTKAGNDFGSLSQEEVLKEITKIVEVSLNKMMDLVQLESGNYTFVVTIEYRNPTSRMFTIHHTARSSVSFVIGDKVKDYYRSSLQQTLLVTATNAILEKNQQVVYPEYQPLDVVVA